TPILLPPASEVSVCPEFSGCPILAKEAICELFVSPELSARIELPVCPATTTE
ncbi:hypothetical protein M9458_001611, partial [Cirrhinus mrigala]